MPRGRLLSADDAPGDDGACADAPSARGLDDGDWRRLAHGVRPEPGQAGAWLQSRGVSHCVYRRQPNELQPSHRAGAAACEPSAHTAHVVHQPAGAQSGADVRALYDKSGGLAPRERPCQPAERAGGPRGAGRALPAQLLGSPADGQRGAAPQQRGLPDLHGNGRLGALHHRQSLRAPVQGGAARRAESVRSAAVS